MTAKLAASQPIRWQLPRAFYNQKNNVFCNKMTNFTSPRHCFKNGYIGSNWEPPGTNKWSVSFRNIIYLLQIWFWLSEIKKHEKTQGKPRELIEEIM